MQMMLERTTLLLFMVVMTLGISYGMHTYSLTTFVKTDIGAAYDEIAAVGIAKFLPYVLVPFFIGILLNRIRSGYIIIVGVALHAIPLFMISMAETIAEIILYQFAIGAAHAFIWPPVNSVFSTNSETRIKNIARASMFFLIGLTLGPLMGMGIMDATDENYRLLFQLSAVVMASSSILVMLLHARLPSVKLAPMDPKSFGKILHFPVVVALVFFTTAVSGILFVIYPAFLVDNGISASAILFLYFVYGGVRVAVTWLVNFLHRWMMPILTMCIVMTTGGLAISLFSSSFVQFAVAMCMMGFAIMAYPICLEIILSRTKRSIANKMVGAYASLVGFGWFVGPAIAGYTAHWFGPDAPYLLFCIVGVGMSIAAVTLRKALAVVEARHEATKDVNQLLKNHFNVMLLSIGLMDRALAKAKTYEDVSPKIRAQYDQLDHTIEETNKDLSVAVELMDETSIEEMRSVIHKIEHTDPAAGAGKGYPDYDEVRENIAGCVEHLNEAMNVDVVSDVRNWLHAHALKKR